MTSTDHYFVINTQKCVIVLTITCYSWFAVTFQTPQIPVCITLAARGQHDTFNEPQDSPERCKTSLFVFSISIYLSGAACELKQLFKIQFDPLSALYFSLDQHDQDTFCSTLQTPELTPQTQREYSGTWKVDMFDPRRWSSCREEKVSSAAEENFRSGRLSWLLV